mmetsp:Transcript_70105/g.194948  ORF Transcript_70105/g.194948 Transcript_70105/m.194948 type:complete len:328 (-) Transcript_70105:79-1062(-)
MRHAPATWPRHSGQHGGREARTAVAHASQTHRCPHGRSAVVAGFSRHIAHDGSSTALDSSPPVMGRGTAAAAASAALRCSSTSRQRSPPSRKNPSQHPIRPATFCICSVAPFPSSALGRVARRQSLRCNASKTSFAFAMPWASGLVAPASRPASCKSQKTRLSFRYGLLGSPVQRPWRSDSTISRKAPPWAVLRRDSTADATRDSASERKKDRESVGYERWKCRSSSKAKASEANTLARNWNQSSRFGKRWLSTRMVSQRCCPSMTRKSCEGSDATMRRLICPNSRKRPVRSSASRFSSTLCRTTSWLMARLLFMGTKVHAEAAKSL